MEPIKITFLEGSATGLRRLTMDNWAGACLVVSRDHFVAAQRSEHLMCPGVYILVGPSHVDETVSPPRLVSRIYIGMSDSLDERLSRHHHSPKKEFWSIAFAFYRQAEDLHAGQLKQLEAFLIHQARSAGNDVIQNAALPQVVCAENDRETITRFAKHIEFMLQALGYDFFSDQRLTDAVHLKRVDKQEVELPARFHSLVEHLKSVLLRLPEVVIYSTEVPDVRAKVMRGNDSRIFARIEFRKESVKLKLIRTGVSKTLTALSEVDDSLIEEIGIAHHQALTFLAQ